MATLSFADLKNTALPSLWDSATIVKAQLADGTTFEQMVADIEAGLSEVNGELLSMPHYAEMVAVQEDPEVEYPVGVSNGVEEATEYAVPTPKRGATTGHMLPLKKYDRALGWTMMYLRDARQKKLDADVRSAVTDIRSGWQKHLLTRFFKVEGGTVGSTSNADVPLADGGAVDSSYIPPESPSGETFLYTHNHFLRHAAISDANLFTAVDHLREHGHASPFDIVAAEADVATWTALTGFHNPEWAGIVYRTTERAAIADNSQYWGYIETDAGIARLWLSPRVPTAYYGVWKTYGAGDSRNPLRVRFNPNLGFGWRLVPGTWVNAPHLMAVLYSEYGVGIGEDRTNGVCVYIAGGGSYATPTIS